MLKVLILFLLIGAFGVGAVVVLSIWEERHWREIKKELRRRRKHKDD